MLSWVKISSFVSALVLGLIFVLGLSACGFTPLYGTENTSAANNQAQQSAATTAALDLVFIENIPDREGQYLRNALIDRFYRNGRPSKPVYKLSLSPIAETRTNLDITKSADATRAQMKLGTHMRLTNIDTGETILSRSLNSITSYNVLQSHFTTRVSEDNARRNDLDDLARQIEQQISLYFKRKMHGTSE